MAKQDNFSDIFEEMTWQMFKMSGGNPYLMQDIVKDRNEQREKNSLEISNLKEK